MSVTDLIRFRLSVRNVVVFWYPVQSSKYFAFKFFPNRSQLNFVRAFSSSRVEEPRSVTERESEVTSMGILGVTLTLGPSISSAISSLRYSAMSVASASESISAVELLLAVQRGFLDWQ